MILRSNLDNSMIEKLLLEGQFIRIDIDEDGYSVRVFRLNGKEYAIK